MIDERPKIAKTLLLRHVMRRVSERTSFLHKKPQSKTVDDEICESNNAFCMIENKRRSKELKRLSSRFVYFLALYLKANLGKFLTDF